MRLRVRGNCTQRYPQNLWIGSSLTLSGKPDFVVLADYSSYNAARFCCGNLIMQAVAASPSVPVGKIKSFGPFGPKYEVGQTLRQLADGDWIVEVTMVETGEKAEYRWTRLSEDPEAY